MQLEVYRLVTWLRKYIWLIFFPFMFSMYFSYILKNLLA